MTNENQWAKQEQQKLDVERDKARAEKGYLPIFTLQRGENAVELVDASKPPREYEGENGVRKVFSVRHDGKEYDLFINPRSPVYREIVTTIAGGKTRLVILREGQGKDTRDVLKQAQ